MSRSCTHESHSAWCATADTLTWPGGASASERHPWSSSDSSWVTSASVDAAKRSSTTAGGSALSATSAAGEATGSKVARNLVGDPATPAPIENDQNELVLSRCTMTSRTSQPSHRVGRPH